MGCWQASRSSTRATCPTPETAGRWSMVCRPRQQQPPGCQQPHRLFDRCVRWRHMPCKGIKLCRAVVAQPAFDSIRGEELQVRQQHTKERHELSCSKTSAFLL